jgi:hypothetical protein
MLFLPEVERLLIFEEYITKYLSDKSSFSTTATFLGGQQQLLKHS